MPDQYSTMLSSSASLFDRASAVMPGGISHDSRQLDPFPHYVSRAAGSRKWDEDGNELIDYVVGHAALILGHSHPVVVNAIQQQVAQMTHPGACHRLEVEWAELICRLVPSVESVRFVMSGTEATLLAMRIARAHTGRDVVVRVQGHFHGWHDYVAGKSAEAFDVAASAGVPAVMLESVRVARLNDIEHLRAAIAAGDVAAVILEPEGARSGTIPPPPGYLEAVRQATQETETLLIFDEVVSGFRLAPGGAQEYYGVVPDLTALAKAVAGGLPGGAVGGKREIMEVLSWRQGLPRALHQGTWNGNPLSAAAGIAALTLLSDGTVQAYATSVAEQLRNGLNRALTDARVGGFALGHHSSFRIIVGDDLPIGQSSGECPPARLLEGMRQPLGWALQRALLLEGVDFMRGDHGWLSLAHSAAEVETTVAAFERAIDRVVSGGQLSRRAAEA
jgi:glutamate-1-semialdehyde 2,1-aminomutase